MIGRDGDDVFHVDNAGDMATELAGQGNDTIVSIISRTLDANVENLVLVANAGMNTNIDGTGNALANSLTGNGGNNVLDGGGAGDSMAGGFGNDTYIADSADSVIELEGAGIDTVRTGANLGVALAANVENLMLTGTADLIGFGNGLDNALTGNAGDNHLDGLAGNDTARGGIGNDTYLVDSAGDVVVEAAGEGNDTVFSPLDRTLWANIENLTLIGGAIVGIGNTLANVLTGNDTNNVLDGKAGADTMKGGLGNDTYRVDAAGDRAIENSGQGTDLVQASVSFTLVGNVENLTLTGNTGINATGNALANTLIGNNAANLLNGMAGADVMSGNDGNDTYVVDNAGDVVKEGSGKGTDLVQASVSHTLTVNVERLTLTGGANIGGTGNALGNTIVGNAGNNLIAGKNGNDLLTTGGGVDIVLFDTALNAASNFDTVADFDVANDTFRLDRDVFTALTALGTLSADAFRVGGAAADAEDRIIYNPNTDNLSYDRDGTGAASAIIFAHVNGNPSLTNADFVVVA
jgi:Ca2+-binding RTX toxin-like protein